MMTIAGHGAEEALGHTGASSGGWHQTIQDYLRDWICTSGKGEGVIRTGPTGRATNKFAPQLGTSINVAYLGLFYTSSPVSKHLKEVQLIKV